MVVGGTGFIGRAVVEALLDGPCDGIAPPVVKVLCRHPPPPAQRNDRVQYVIGDLSDPRTLQGVCSGLTTVVHAASYVGGEPRHCREVNHLGTLALLEESGRADVRRFVYISTAAVYGFGPHRGLTEMEAVPAPQSAASASRLEAEHAVRRAGGVVLRPHLIYGPGDRWFIPTMARLLHRVPMWPRGLSPHSSVLHANDLGRVVAALVDGERPPAAGHVYHVAHPRPESMRALASTVCRWLGLPQPEDSLSAAEHRLLTTQALPALSAHQYDLLTQDHWYDTSRIWRHTEVACGAGFKARFAECSGWYRRHLVDLLEA
ncbi:NAD-dependent epimerase/dehydratase family protein [Streptomyces caeni]|uniref:NAD-dependent epimerase/dehydratase family protein n=1 Tax=Streptomyces caeni TaxID=2307231 RepID=A0ABW4IS47_9ACTN